MLIYFYCHYYKDLTSLLLILQGSCRELQYDFDLFCQYYCFELMLSRVSIRELAI